MNMAVSETTDLHVKCNICEAAGPSLLVTKDGYQVYQCAECGLAFTYPQPEAIAEQYDASYFDLYRCRREFRLKRADDRLRRIELMREPGRLLDIGCSLGYFIEAANTRGWAASGVEISEHAAEEARKIGLDVCAGLLEDAHYADESFDCVTMWDVLEHVQDPTAHMLEIGRILAPGGMVVIGTPNLAHLQFRRKREHWRHLKPAEHIFYFSEPNLARLLAKTGFGTVRPSLIEGRAFPGSLGAAIKAQFAQLAHINDVMIVYGVKNGL